MKLLYIKSTGFKNIEDNCEIDFIAKSKKTTEDKEYELQEIAEDLYVFNTNAFIGKNASGKTTILELIDCCYSILGNFSLSNKNYSFDDIHLEIIFYHEDNIYKYITDISTSLIDSDKASFKNQMLFYKKYYKTKINEIILDKGYEIVPNIYKLPSDRSIVFFVLNEEDTKAVYFNCNGDGVNTYKLLFNALKRFKLSDNILTTILKLFDNNINSLRMLDDNNFELIFDHKIMNLSANQLINYLSSGTTKGLLLYVYIVASLKYGFDIIIDEIENHFHKILVENIINLYKDKNINRLNATFYFSTHYVELLDLFNRQDNIWVCHATKKITINNMYLSYNVRNELLKSKQFYNDTFNTSVNYDDLMAFNKYLVSICRK